MTPPDDSTPDPDDSTAAFLFGADVRTITAADLAQIRDRVADAVHASALTDRDQLASELTVATPDIDDGVPRVGRWLLEQRDDGVYLVRHPNRGPLMRFVLVQVRLDKTNWEAADISEERVTTR